MKKVLCLVISLALIMAIGSLSFAVEESTVKAGTTIENAYDATYGGETTKIDDGDIPKGPGTLPKTGGIPAEAFYVAGALLVVVALIISKKSVKTAGKH